MEKLTQEQIDWVVKQMARWLDIRREHQDSGSLYMVKYLHKVEPDQRAKMILGQLSADVWHSALLRRLLSGKEPLPEPPPLEYSYPVYPKDE